MCTKTKGLGVETETLTGGFIRLLSPSSALLALVHCKEP